MDNSQRPLVNERLYYCRLHLDYLAAELLRQDTPKAILENAIGDSILFHLMLCYRAYLSEIAESYALPASDFSSARVLVEGLRAAEQESAEANELLSLEASGSWLSALFQHYRSIMSGKPATSSPQVPSESPIIYAAQQDEADHLGLKEYEGVFHALTELISRQRTCLEEW